MTFDDLNKLREEVKELLERYPAKEWAPTEPTAWELAMYIGYKAGKQTKQ